MRVLFDSCVYDLRNRGNVAMLQAAINRIIGLWPHATLQVITSGPYILRLYCPKSRPVSPTGVDYWSANQSIYHRVLLHMPVLLLRMMLELREALWQRLRSNETGLSTAQSITDYQESDLSQSGKAEDNNGLYAPWSAESLQDLDLYVCTGGHYLTDVMNKDVLALLNRVELATALGIPVVMVGQGIGPIKDPRLLAKARAVLPKVKLFLIRERLEGPSLLRQLGVDSSRILVTGDDAVELAHTMARQEIGVHIGVGFRVAHTTEVTPNHLNVLHSILQEAISKYRCRLIALPVSQSAHELDRRIIERVATGLPIRYSLLDRLSEPKKVINDTGLCRVVITGTYHTAVFALAQGIPVIGLVKSASYINKFAGLADQFKDGMTNFGLDDEFLSEKVLGAMDKYWELASTLKPSLLNAATHQIKANRAGYRQLYQTVQKAKECSILT